ncbi:MAG: GNAT family N-acyltransferase [Pseudomonadota bacterium]
MIMDEGRFTVRLAETDAEIRAAQRLRYRVFVEEMGATPSAEDRALGLERDIFDPYFDHLLLIDRAAPSDALDERVIGVYRLMRGSVARTGRGFYGATEYDLSALEDQGRETLELGRSCIAPAFRGGIAMHLLWMGLARYVLERDIQILFGVASFHGTDLEALAGPLSLLHHEHMAPPDLRVRALPQHYVSMDRMPLDQIDRRAAMRATPSLIKGYIRLGGFVGDGAYVDRSFNTTDVCLIMDTTRMQQRYRDYYTRNASGDQVAV